MNSMILLIICEDDWEQVKACVAKSAKVYKSFKGNSDYKNTPIVEGVLNI